MNFNYLRTSFVGGEISPELGARLDLPIFMNSCSHLSNFIPLAFGSITRTPGTKHLREINNSNFKSRHIKFQATDDSQYDLEFAEGRCYIYTDEGLLVDDRQLDNPYFNLDVGVLGWTERVAPATYDVGNRRILFSLAGGAIYTRLTNPALGEYTVTCDVGEGDLTWSAGLSIGGTQYGSGTLAANGSRSFSFTPTANDSYLYIDFTAVAASTVDNVLLDGPSISFDHPYSETALQEIQFAQSNDVLYIVHNDYIPRRLVRRANNWWAFTTFDSSSTDLSDDPSNMYTEGPYQTLNYSPTTFTPDATTGDVTITSSSESFASTDVGRLIRFRMGPANNDSQNYAGNATQKNFDITFTFSSDAEITVYSIDAVGAYTLQTNPANYTIVGTQVVYGTAPAASVTVRIERSPAYVSDGSWGSARIIEYRTPNIVKASVLSTLPGIQPSTEWQLGAFSTTTGYPRAVTVHEQRLIFGGTISEPSGIWASATANFLDFSPDGGTYTGNISASNSFSLSAAANRVSKIEWLASRINIIVGTSSSVFELAPNGGLNAIELPSVLKRNENGARRVPGVAVGSAILYTNKTGNRLLELNYDITISSLEAIDISILASHLFTSPILRIIYQAEPDQVVWILQEDGAVLSCTYVREQNLRAFARQSFNGLVEDMWSAVEDSYTSIYCMVKRTVNGVAKRYVEKLQQRFKSTSLGDSNFLHSYIDFDQTITTTLDIDGFTGSVIATAGNAQFVVGDVGRYISITGQNLPILITSYIGPTSVRGTVAGTLTSLNIASGGWKLSVTTLSGLGHLEAFTVAVFADGAYVGNQTVSGGVITLPRFAYNIKVGLNYTSTVTTNDFSFETKAGAAITFLRMIREVKLNLYQSYGGLLSTATSSANTSFVTEVLPLTMDSVRSTFNGWVKAGVNASFEDGLNITITQDKPYPLTLNGLVLKCQLGDL